MSARAWALARREDGQSVVFFVVSMSVLFGMLALVVNIGNWYQAHRRAQAAADAAAVATAQDWQQGFGIDVTAFISKINSSADTNWPGSGFRPGAAIVPNRIEAVGQTGNEMMVKVGKSVPNLFGGLIGLDGAASVQASATVRVRVPNSVRWVAPLALYCPSGSSPAWCLDWGTPGTFDFDELFYDTSTFGPLKYAASTIPAEAPPLDYWSDFRCDPSTGTEVSSTTLCDPDTRSAQQWYPRVYEAGISGIFEQTLKDLTDVQAGPYLVAIYDDFDITSDPLGPHPKSFHVIGWAAFTITDIVNTGPTSFQVTGTFDKFYVPADGTSGGQVDFGVRSVELIQSMDGS